MNYTVGIYYERPDGKIAYTFGWNGHDNTISYRLDDDAGERRVSNQEFQAWRPRRDLTDFPNARDPRLPYVFDLHWDLKYESQLRSMLQRGHPDLAEIKALMQTHAIVLK